MTACTVSASQTSVNHADATMGEGVPDLGGPVNFPSDK